MVKYGKLHRKICKQMNSVNLFDQVCGVSALIKRCFVPQVRFLAAEHTQTLTASRTYTPPTDYL